MPFSRYAERAAHTLKGVSGNIGATRLQLRAGELEAALSKHADLPRVEVLVQHAKLLLLDLLDALANRLPQETAMVPMLDVPTEHLQALVTQLMDLLKDDDSSAQDVFADNAGVLQTAFPTCFKEMEEALTGYDFGTAPEYLQTGRAWQPRPLQGRRN